MFEALLKVLGSGLSLWEGKEKTKYVDKLMDLKRRYYEESNKASDVRSDAVLDTIEFELRLLGDAFSARVGQKDAANQP